MTASVECSKPRGGARVLAGLLLFGSAPLCVADFDAVLAAGEARYGILCAACHGKDGEGQGPMAEGLTAKPADLTVLARNNGGAFPFERVYDAIDGRSIPRAHGDRKMPVWGRYLKHEWPGSRTDQDVRGQILELIMYLRELQVQ